MRHSFAIAFGALLILFVMTGCVSKHVDLARERVVSVDVSESSRIRISGVTAHQHDEEFVVAGTIQRRSMMHQRIQGHAHAEVVDPEGETVFKLCEHVIPQNLSRNSRPRSRFAIRFPELPPDNSTVKVRYHMGHEEDCTTE